VAFLFKDWETQSNLDLTITGTLRYVLDPSTRVLLWSWAIDDEPVKLWCPDFGPELVPEVWAFVKSRMAAYGPPPAEIMTFFDTPGNYAVASNMAFDRHVWQQVATPENGFPRIEIEQTLCSQAQAQASNLSGSLDMAGRALGLGNKTVGGKAVMKRFADRHQPLPGSPADIEATMAKGWSREQAIKMAIDMWDLYLTYGVQDTELMREVWKCTRQLDASEWQEYWVSERINDRGMLADLDVCRGAANYHEEEAAYVVEQIKEITEGQIAGPTFTAQINEWVYDRLPDDLAEFMVKKRDEEGYVTNLTGDKNVMTRLLEEIQTSDTPPADEVIDLIEVLQFGRSSSALKFQKILNQEVDGRLGGSYVFNGAGQTGRFSSRGVQVHNLPRAFLDNELDVLDMIAAGLPIEKLRQIGPVSSVLAKLIRPTFIAPPGKLLVWGDWSAIEARVNPWLADSREAEAAVLTPFRESDIDRSIPDVYVLNAGAIFNVPADVIWERYKNGDAEAKGMRQAGKVAVLALGFLGSVGALKAMARGYGMRLTNEEAKVIVDGWRDRNKWARRFGDKCEAAAFAAMRHPMSVHPAGKLKYQYAPDLMGGTLVCFLPDMRPIVYPKAKIVRVEKFGKMTDAISYLNGMGRKNLWNGLQVENGTQATAASILRQTLVSLEAEETEAEIVLHTHDEAGGEVDEAKAGAFAERLENVMTRGWDWTEGLPLAAEISTSWYYTKNPPH
jgi:DNA polymerase